jgi:hypothetical protein
MRTTSQRMIDAPAPRYSDVIWLASRPHPNRFAYAQRGTLGDVKTVSCARL